MKAPPPVWQHWSQELGHTRTPAQAQQQQLEMQQFQLLAETIGPELLAAQAWKELEEAAGGKGRGWKGTGGKGKGNISFDHSPRCLHFCSSFRSHVQPLPLAPFAMVVGLTNHQFGIAHPNCERSAGCWTGLRKSQFSCTHADKRGRDKCRNRSSGAMEVKNLGVGRYECVVCYLDQADERGIDLCQGEACVALHSQLSDMRLPLDMPPPEPAAAAAATSAAPPLATSAAPPLALADVPMPTTGDLLQAITRLTALVQELQLELRGQTALVQELQLELMGPDSLGSRAAVAAQGPNKLASRAVSWW